MLAHSHSLAHIRSTTRLHTVNIDHGTTLRAMYSVRSQVIYSGDLFLDIELYLMQGVWLFSIWSMVYHHQSVLVSYRSFATVSVYCPSYD